MLHLGRSEGRQQQSQCRGTKKLAILHRRTPYFATNRIAAPPPRAKFNVSVSPGSAQRKCCPTWDEMCAIKDMFFGEDERVMQFHPPKSEYINNHPYCLHLWRPIDAEIPRPPAFMVGSLA